VSSCSSRKKSAGQISFRLADKRHWKKRDINFIAKIVYESSRPARCDHRQPRHKIMCVYYSVASMNEMRLHVANLVWQSGLAVCFFNIMIHTTYTILQFIALHCRFRVANVWHPIVALRHTLKSNVELIFTPYSTFTHSMSTFINWRRHFQNHERWKDICL